jgi:hypothetical protein
MDISSRFSLVDFLAYLFPGFIGVSGFYALLLLTPPGSSLTVLPDFTTGILLLTLSYIVGVVLSGPAEIIIKLRMGRRGFVKSTIPMSEFQEELVSAFGAFLGNDEETKITWSVNCFYICRSLVLEFMPHLGQMIQRQSSLRQLRMNLIPSATIWSVAGVGWGIKVMSDDLIVWGCVLAITSMILWFPVVGTTINRMESNEKREVREVLTAFLAGYKSGLFDKKK